MPNSNTSETRYANTYLSIITMNIIFHYQNKEIYEHDIIEQIFCLTDFVSLRLTCISFDIS